MIKAKQLKTKFLELLESSTITQSYITMCVITTVCVMWGMQVPIPEGLQAVVLIVVGFFFGTKAAKMQKKGE